MYQASSMRLVVEKEGLEDVLEEAKQRLQEGEAPTDEAEREWYRQERERMNAAMYGSGGAKGYNNARSVGSDAYSQGGGAATRADMRPTAYIPESLGIPKPFGKWAPFKPSEQGSTMRHIRKPQRKEIEI